MRDGQRLRNGRRLQGLPPRGAVATLLRMRIAAQLSLVVIAAHLAAACGDSGPGSSDALTDTVDSDARASDVGDTAVDAPADADDADASPPDAVAPDADTNVDVPADTATDAPADTASDAGDDVVPDAPTDSDASSDGDETDAADTTADGDDVASDAATDASDTADAFVDVAMDTPSDADASDAPSDVDATVDTDAGPTTDADADADATDTELDAAPICEPLPVEDSLPGPGTTGTVFTAQPLNLVLPCGACEYGVVVSWRHTGGALFGTCFDTASRIAAFSELPTSCASAPAPTSCGDPVLPADGNTRYLLLCRSGPGTIEIEWLPDDWC